MKKSFDAFGYALAGLLQTIKKERNFRIELFIAALAFTAGVYFDITKIEWLVVLINTAVVLSAELFNTAIEKMCDAFCPDFNPQIKIVKDGAAAAVLVCAVAAAVCGTIIFLPYFLQLFKTL